MNVLNTRPETEAAALNRRLAELGHDAVSCPMLIIKPRLDATVDLSGAQAIAVPTDVIERSLQAWQAAAAEYPQLASR